MPNLTTDSLKYFNEVKNQLTLNFELGWTPLWNYCELSQLQSSAYSFTFLLKDGFQNRKLLYKGWDNNLHNEIQFGIYDLSSIQIKEKEKRCSLNDIFQIQEMIKKELTTFENIGIILDGYYNQFTDFKLNKCLSWDYDSQMNENLSILINKIKELKNT